MSPQSLCSVRNIIVTTELVFGQKYNCHHRACVRSEIQLSPQSLCSVTKYSCHHRACVRSEIQLSPQSLCSVRNTIVTTEFAFGQKYNCHHRACVRSEIQLSPLNFCLVRSTLNLRWARSTVVVTDVDSEIEAGNELADF